MPTDPGRIVFCTACDAAIDYSAASCRSCGAKQPERADSAHGIMVIAAFVGLVMLIAALSSHRPNPVLLALGYALFSIGAGWLILRSAVRSAIISARRVTHPDG